MDEIINLDVDYINILENDSDYMVVQLDLLYYGQNRNNCIITEAAVRDAIPTIYNKYIIYRYDPYLNDFEEHNRSDADTTMTICGHIPSQAATSFVNRDGRTYLRVEGVISKLYQPKVYDILKRRHGEVKVSIEMKLLQSSTDANGITVVDKFSLLGVCLLGQYILEGIDGSKVEVLKYSFDGGDSHYCKFAALHVPPAAVRKNCEDALAFIKENKRGGTIASKALAAKIVNGESLDDATLKKMCRFYAAHCDANDAPADDTAHVTWMSWGGKEGYDWVIHSLNPDVIFSTSVTLVADKSEKAMSDKPWGDVDKTKLRDDIMNAANKNELVHDVYLLVESGWEEAPSEKLKYPVMEIVNGKLVYNRYGLSAALSYARAENVQEVVKKVESLYKKLNIENGEDTMKNKLDKDNKEMEDVREEIDADEDDEKEKVDNAAGDKAESKLEDDAKSDEDYWKKKYADDTAAMTEKCAALEQDIEKYRKACEAYEKKEIAAKYSKMFKDDAERDSMVEKCSKDELEAEIKNRALEFAMQNMGEDKAHEIAKNAADFPAQRFSFTGANPSKTDIFAKYAK